MLTTMCDESTLNSITNVVSYFEELVNTLIHMKKTGICDKTLNFNPKEILKINKKKTLCQSN